MVWVCFFLHTNKNKIILIYEKLGCMHAQVSNALKRKNIGGVCTEYLCLVFRNYIYLMDTEGTVGH